MTSEQNEDSSFVLMCRAIPVYFLFLVLTILQPALATETADAASPGSIPAAAFFDDPDIGNPVISPDGKRLAFTAMLGTGRLGVALMDLETGKVDGLVGATDVHIDELFWKDNDLLVFGATNEFGRWDPLRSISLQTRTVVALAEAGPAVPINTKHTYAAVIDRLSSRPGFMLVESFTTRMSRVIEFQLMDARTGELRRTEKDSDDMRISTIVAGSDGTILARKRSKKGADIIEIRESGGAPYVAVSEIPWTEAGWRMLGVVDDKTLYVSVESDTPQTSICPIPLSTGKIGAAILEVPDGMTRSILLSHDRKVLLGAFITGDKPAFHWFDPTRAKIQEQIDTALPGTFNAILNASNDDRVILIHAANDRDPGTYYILNRNSSRIMPVGKVRHRIDPSLMRPMEPVRFKARDGLEVRAYLTRPISSGGGAMPLLVWPHSGPFDLRDTWGFDSDVQFFASRGYAVLQVNYRGSTGFGMAFERAGWQQTGDKMVDDLVDGVRWAVENGIADPTRVAIAGVGFGGYLAMMGAIRYPEVFRCSIEWAGTKDLSGHLRVGRMYGRSTEDYLKVRFGETTRFLRDKSPDKHADKLTNPSLHINLYAGTNYVEPSWENMRFALKRNNLPFEEFGVEDPEIFSNLAQATAATNERILTFLAKHMPADN